MLVILLGGTYDPLGQRKPFFPAHFFEKAFPQDEDNGYRKVWKGRAVQRVAFGVQEGLRVWSGAGVVSTLQ